MLQVFSAISEIQFGQLMRVYLESNQKDSLIRYPDYPEDRRLLEIEQDFYAYLRDFFRQPDALYAAWVEEGQYKAALRCEPYKDGVLIEGLETAPESRRKGYATSLLQEFLIYLQQQGVSRVYSHIAKNNIASIKVHQNCGFIKYSDCSVYIDGSVDYKSITYIKVFK